MSWYFRSLKKYADFKGRARRKEYWGFALVHIIISCAFLIMFLGAISDRNGSAANSLSILYILYALAVMVPGCAVAVRRLHDTGRTGWWLLWVGAFFFSFSMVVSPQFSNSYVYPYSWWYYPATVTLAVLFGITQICFFVFTVLDSKPGENQYGSNPKGMTEAPAPPLHARRKK